MNPMKSTIPVAKPIEREVPKVDLEAMAERSQSVLDAGRFQPKDEDGLERLARRYYYSGTLPDSYYPKNYADRWKEGWADAGISKAFVVMLYGAAIGILPSLAIWCVHIINGRPCPSADFMFGRMLATGILRRDDFSLEADKTRCKIVIGIKTRAEKDRIVVEAKYEDFKHLHGKDTWRNDPEAQLVARAKSRATRRYAPDSFTGVYSVEEMHDVRDDAAAKVDYEVPPNMMPTDGGQDLVPVPTAKESGQGMAEAAPVVDRAADAATLLEEIKAADAQSDWESLKARAAGFVGTEFHGAMQEAWRGNPAAPRAKKAAES